MPRSQAKHVVIHALGIYNARYQLSKLNGDRSNELQE